LFVDDIVTAAERVVAYVGEMSIDAFTNDSKTIDAVIRNLEIIREAAKHVSDEFREGGCPILGCSSRGDAYLG
jgi:hypothetical protein